MTKLKKPAHFWDNDWANVEPAQGVKNIVVFGETGVGKSSLINLIAGRSVTEASSGALGCTLTCERYLLDLRNQQFAIWDTAGLDEGTQGSVPAEKAEAYLKQLLHELAKTSSIDLLVYCVRGTRVRTALLTNYHVFHSAICRKKVPIVIVVTGLENQEGSMETWWHNNERRFASLKMFFDGHACVTTLESSIQNPFLKERREISRTAVIDMVISTCRTRQWKPPERSWIESAYSDVRAMLSPKDGPNTRLPTIIMCEAYRSCDDCQLVMRRSISFQNPLIISQQPRFRSPVLISSDTSRSRLPFEQGVKCTPVNKRLYRVYQVPPEGVEEEETKTSTVMKRGADLLIFCVKMDETESKVIKSQWDYFNLTYGGDLSPRIVVVIGTSDQSRAEQWWEGAVGETLTRNDVDLAYLPEAMGSGNAQLRLQHLISDRCIDCSKAKSMENEELFKPTHSLNRLSLSSWYVKPESMGKEAGPPTSEQDMITDLGVWHEAADRTPGPMPPISAESSHGHFLKS